MRDGDAQVDGARAGVVATAGGSVLFVAMGALYAMYGPVLPALEDRFGLPEGRAALVVTTHFAGTIVGIVGWIVLAPALGARRGLLVGAGLLGAGAVGFATGASWPIALAAASVIGLGFGTLLVGLTSTFATVYGRRGAAILNLLTAVFGAGAIAGPLAVSAIGGDRFGATYLAGAILAALGLVLIGTLRIADERSDRRAGGGGRSLGAILRVRAPVWGFVALFVGYVGVESGAAGFIVTHLREVGVGSSAAEAWSAGFWTAIAFGRLLAAPLSLRLAPGTLVAGSLAVAIAGLLAANIDAAAPAAYLVIGLGLAPVFPTGLAWLSASTGPDDASSASLVILGAQFGGVLVPAVVGAVVGATSAALVPPALLVVAVACLITTLVLGRRLREREGVRRGEPASDEQTTASVIA